MGSRTSYYTKPLIVLGRLLKKSFSEPGSRVSTIGCCRGGVDMNNIAQTAKASKFVFHQPTNCLSMLLVFLLLPLLILGCAEPFKDYGFKPNEVAFKWGSLKASLIGTEKKGSWTVVKGSPYELFISFDADAKEFMSVTIVNLILKDSRTKQAVYEHRGSLTQSFDVVDKARKKAYFRFNNINFQYSEMTLHIDFIINNGSMIGPESAVIEFEQKFTSTFRVIGV